ncbi:ribonuclease G [Porticoccus litoralis]|uniref:Ribonuclease G n=1 Tax=Porticoccus litoralis TaxID=434086 RepID=A0AAW8B2Y4_9GAMM|nr:ribonuclease G [Porticoccus litoralis]MDP1520268.1 ribonuclease G [Porticoccus litoralis]
MSSEILINITPMETRVALVENGVLQDVMVERTSSRGIVGNIYKGKVVRVLPGMQAAFVDIGLEKAGFIHVDDIHKPSATGDNGASWDIVQCLREGQSVVAQVIKDPISTKGARLSTRLTVSSRYLVYMPEVDHLGISQRIEDEAERERLINGMEQALAGMETRGGYIIRTAAEGVDVEELGKDIQYLHRLWSHVHDKAGQVQAPATVYEDLPLYLRSMRDMPQPLLEKVRVDSGEAYAKLCDFAAQFNPDMVGLIECYSADRPLFYLYGVEDEISRALEKKVPLKSGGYLVIDQTEAMTTIDINTGAFVGKRNLEETIFKTNLEATATIARQLRLRNLGGIIIIDFIDMQDPEHRRQVLRALEKALSRDRAKTAVVSVSELGLVEMTRKRTSESLGQLLCEACPVCDGKGSLKSAETVCYEILRELLREARTFECEGFLVLAAPVVIDRLLDEDSAYVADLEGFVGRTIQFRVESMYSRDQYDIIPI